MLPKVIVIVGPTASGKSDLGIRLAKKFNGEIISADSRQVYRGMDIGTGKVSKKEQELVPHHLLDVANPKRTFSAARYKKRAEKALQDILRRKKTPIIVGGTGFYIDTLLGRISLPEVPPNTKLRAELEQQSAEHLFKRLKRLDPVRAQTIDPHNKRRLIRAIEIISYTGKPIPKKESPNIRYNVLWVGMNPPQEILERKIKKRLRDRLQNGMVREVKKLHNQGLSYQRLENLGLEYRWVARYLQNKIIKENLEEELFLDIRRYAKRQMTWFQRNKEIHWITNFTESSRLVRTFISSPK